MRFFRNVLIMVAVGYIAALSYFAVKQRDYIYYPDAGPLSMDEVDVDTLQIVQFDTADGETLSAFYIPPAREDAPVFLYFDGNGSRISLWEGRWRRIAEAGAGALAVSYRGYPGSTGTPSEQGLYADSDAAWKWLTARHPPDRIVLHGFSLGTGVVSRLGSLHETRAVILEAPYTALDDRAAEAMPFFPVKWLIQDRFRTRERIRDITQPLLIVHSEGDTVIPVRHGRKLAELSGPNAHLIVTPGGDHSTATRNGLYPLIWDFLDYVPAPATE